MEMERLRLLLETGAAISFLSVKFVIRNLASLLLFFVFNIGLNRLSRKLRNYKEMTLLMKAENSEAD